MSKQKIAPDRRYVIWLAHDQKCWFCREPVPFSETHIDHIVPESLAGQEELSAYIADLGLPGDFDLFADANLAPAHSRCNLYKLEHKLEPTALMQKVLEDNLGRVERIAAIREKLVSDRNVAKSFATLCAAIEEGVLNPEVRGELIARLQPEIDTVRAVSAPFQEGEQAAQPLRLAPWLEVVSQSASGIFLRGPTGLLGIRPEGDDLHSSWDCPNCGVTGWNGARCIVCGELNDE